MRLKILMMGMVLWTGCQSGMQKRIIAQSSENPKLETVSVYTTAADSANLRLTLNKRLQWQELKQPLETQIAVFVDPNKTYQSFLGIGAAFTDASAETFYKLPADKRKEVLQAYFDTEKGIGYTLARTTIHSSDFSSGSYTYIEEGDAALNTFSLAHDQQFRIPFIKEAMASAGGKLTLYVSPWSAPAFMKTNGNMLQGGKLKPEFAQSWANYFVKFIKGYEQLGIPIWGLTVQNEPMATQRWESMIFSAGEERDFLKNFLGPTLAKNDLGDKKIIVWDHNRDLIYHRAQTIFDDPEASKYAWGIGFHWYENWSGGDPMYGNIGAVHQAFPDKHILFTEGTVERFDPKKYDFWANGERYGRSMIHDFNNGTVGWTDWNILLDQTGGPNHVGNFCFAPIHGDTQTGTLIYTNSYYYIGHFSKFIRPGAKRIGSVASRSQLLTTAFRNENGSTAVIVMNQSDQKIDYFLMVGTQAISVSILPHAIQTLIF